MPALHLSPTVNFFPVISKYLFSWITSLFQLSFLGQQIGDLCANLVFILLMDEFSECGNSPLSWNCESKNNPMPDYACVIGGCDTFRLLSVFKKNRIIDSLDCSKVRFSTLPFTVRIQVLSPFSKSASPLDLHLYTFPLTTSGNIHTYYTVFLNFNLFIGVFLGHLNMKQTLYYWKKCFLNLRTHCSHWCVHHLLTVLSAGIFLKHRWFLKPCISAVRSVRCILSTKEVCSSRRGSP